MFELSFSGVEDEDFRRSFLAQRPECQQWASGTPRDGGLETSDGSGVLFEFREVPYC